MKSLRGLKSDWLLVLVISLRLVEWCETILSFELGMVNSL